MAHNAKVFPVAPTDGVTTFTSAEVVAMDNNGYVAINGDAGGTWAPTNPVVLGGQGIQPTLAPTTWPNFAADTSSKRTIVRILHAMPYAKLAGGTVADGGITGGGIGSCFNRIIDTVPHGATITLIRAMINFVGGRASLPTTYPMLSVRRIPAATGILSVYLKSTDAGSGVNETFAVPPLLATYNALANSVVTYTPDQNNVLDRTQYAYHMQIFDEAGGGAVAGNIFKAIEITYTLTQFEVG